LRFLVPVLLVTSLAPNLCAQVNYAGAFGGLSLLSGDGRSMVSQDFSQVSIYDPRNGPSFWFFAGRHVHDYVSLQASYAWSRNSLTMTSTENSGGEFRYYEQRREAVRQSVIADALLYFRRRGSWVRPYLSAGFGVVHLESNAGRIERTSGELPAPAGFSSTDPALRVAVGIDLAIHGGWAFRYSFSETITHNPISRQLTPPGKRSLMHFENLFGFVKRF
jgi:opacity protein-like surface antigen